MAGTRGQGLGVSEVGIVNYGVLGRNVAVLVDEKKAPGTDAVTFDASKLASGTYFCEMRAGSFADTKKIMLTK